MPLYFFDIDERLVDEQGIDLPDLQSAEAYAAGLVSTFPPPGAGQPRRSVIIRTEAETLTAAADAANRI